MNILFFIRTIRCLICEYRLFCVPRTRTSRRIHVLPAHSTCGAALCGGRLLNSKGELMQEVKALRRRISVLSAASLRISASLDLDTVLHEVVDSARTLTGSGYGLIITLDDAGQPQDFVSAGLSAEAHRRLVEWPDGPRLFEHLRDLPGVLRLADVHVFVRSLGFSADLLPSRTFQGTPMRHQGVHVGNFYLVDKEGGKEFSDEDEEILVLFASQAASAIANARTYRAERLARADLEALVDTSPVGVAVFNAKTGALVSLNREATRIVEHLHLPGTPPEQLLKVITCRRADGREIALDQLPLSRELAGAETVRVEEVVLSTPDGRSVTTLINATPIRAEDGVVESVVVTLQDLAPLKKMDRMRAEFLSMVSHELRAPLTSIKGSTATVLGASPVFGAAEMLQFFRIIDEQADHMSGLIADLLDAGRIDSGTLSVTPEPSEVGALVDQARNTFLSSGARHTVLINLAPDLPRIMADPRRIVQVLNNLLSNAARYAPESAPIRVSAVRDGVHVALSVSDEGRALRPSVWRTCLTNTPALWGAVRTPGRAVPDSAWPSARGWSRLTAGAFAPKAAGRARAPGSRSHSRWPRRPAPWPVLIGAGRGRTREGANRYVSWSWTTTRRRCTTCAMRSPRRVLRRW